MVGSDGRSTKDLSLDVPETYYYIIIFHPCMYIFRCRRIYIISLPPTAFENPKPSCNVKQHAPDYHTNPHPITMNIPSESSHSGHLSYTCSHMPPHKPSIPSPYFPSHNLRIPTQPYLPLHLHPAKPHCHRRMPDRVLH